MDDHLGFRSFELLRRQAGPAEYGAPRCVRLVSAILYPAYAPHRATTA